jgi:membrane fusion protein, copper/silver efflux system
MKPRSNKYLKYTLLLLGGIFLGWLFFHNPKTDKSAGLSQAEETNTVWTCSMHPQIRMDKPGDCPICGMDLIPVGQSGDASYDPDAIHLSRDAAQLASVMTTVVTRQNPEKEVRLYGKVRVDERLLQSQVAHVSGRIERLNVNFTGETVKRGQLLAEIYSPDLITAQQELLQTYKTRQVQPGLYEASRERLKQWKLSDDQINQVESTGKYTTNIRIYSTTTGTVTARYVSTGDYVARGSVLFEIADLSKVWVLFDAYESDLPFLNKGTKVTFTLQSLPGKEYSGNISFIDPVIDPVTRVAGVRVEINNKSGELKPEMFVTGIVNSELEGIGDELVIPASAVLWTGKRSIVYVKEPGDELIFKMRMIELGPMLGNSYIVMDGPGMKVRR